MYCTPTCHSTAMVLASSTRSPMVWMLRLRAASTSVRTRSCSCGSAASSWMMVPAIFTKSSCRASSMPALSRPEPKPSSAKRKRRARSTAVSALTCARWLAALSSVIWKHSRCGSARLEQVIVEPLEKARVAHGLLRQAHEQTLGFPLRRERQRRADHPAVDALEQIVARGGRHELRRQHFPALVVDHAHQHVEHARRLALKTRDRLLHQPEAVLHQRRLDVL